MSPQVHSSGDTSQELRDGERLQNSRHSWGKETSFIRPRLETSKGNMRSVEGFPTPPKSPRHNMRIMSTPIPRLSSITPIYKDDPMAMKSMTTNMVNVLCMVAFFMHEVQIAWCTTLHPLHSWLPKVEIHATSIKVCIL